MEFKVIYNVFNIPNDNGMGVRTFSFTYEAELNQLHDLSSHINEYLQEYFTVENYELISFTKVAK